MNLFTRDRALYLIAGMAASLPVCGGNALAEPTIGADVSGMVEYATNPFLLVGNNNGAVRGSVSISPSIENRTPRTSWRLSGNATLSEYSRLYQGTADYLGQVNYQNALTTRLNLNATAAYSSSISRSYQPDSVVIGGTPSNLPDVTDITLIGLQERRDSLRGAVGMSYTPSARDNWSLNFDASDVRVPSNAVLNGLTTNNYRTYAGNFGYSRTLTARLSLGASVGVSRFDYRASSLGDSTVISPNFNATLRLSSDWSLSGGLGASFLRQTTVFGPQNTRDLSANLRACRDGPRQDFCFSGSRSTSPSSLGAARKTTAVGASYDYRLTSRDSLSFSGNYVRSEESVAGPVETIDYLSGFATYQRKINDKFGLSVDAGFTRSDFRGTRTDARAGVRLSYNWNNRR